MKYLCNFFNPDTDERKSITAALSQEQVAAIGAMRAAQDENADLQAMACALGHAYREVPKGFHHTEPPTLVLMQ